MGRSRASLHLALFPFPLQGHITPMMQLASLLHSRGFSITIVHAHFNAPDPRNHPHFRFESFADGIDPDLVAGMGIMDQVYTIIAHCEQPLVSLMKRIQSGDEFVDCIVSDSLYSGGRVAGELGLPWVVLRTNSPTSFMLFGSFVLLHQLGYLPVKDPEAMIKELPPFRVKDLPIVEDNQTERFFKTMTEVVDSTLKSSAILMNSFDKLEQPALDWIRSRTQAPVYLLGPLCATYSAANPGTMFQQDRSCLTWLDRHAHGSVIYISIGSVATMSPAELVELAQGLGDCQHPFLWVIRPGSVKSEESVRFLDRFADETKDRGCMVKWAPQTEVLAHPAVGVFMSHCGWNSTLESICAGKPMLCWPAFGDQKVNTRMICHVWGNGMEMGEKLESEKVKNSVRELIMGEKEGKKIREKARLLQELALDSLKVGGSSHTAVNELKAHISSLNSPNCESN
ncbi:UDP-glycosyltransferase 76B1-like [Nymphaea colorata]|nr:UDP-glycosyltransferase 76B1-like [Nymphaea colorata]